MLNCKEIWKKYFSFQGRMGLLEKSGYWIFVTLVPVFGILLIIYWITRPSVDNRTD